MMYVIDLGADDSDDVVVQTWKDKTVKDVSDEDKKPVVTTPEVALELEIVR